MGLYKKLRKYLTGRRMAWPPPRSEGLSLSDINLRDPFIVRDGQGGYLLTGTVYHYNYNDAGMCLCWKSRDLESWSGPFKLIDGEELGGVYYDFWAPEIHFIGGKYHLLITLRPQGGKRGVYLFTADKADGKYAPAARLTPWEENCLDGTFYEGKDGAVYFAYCREYTDVKDGQVRCMRFEREELPAPAPALADVPCLAGQSKLLFKGSGNIFRPARGRQKVTDGPFYFEREGRICLLWSTHVRGGRYALLWARAKTDAPDGEFEQMGALYDKDGGHAMIFCAESGQKYLVLHSPNARTVLTKKFEHPHLLPAEF